MNTQKFLKKNNDEMFFRGEKGKVENMKNYRKYFIFAVLTFVMFISVLLNGDSTRAGAATRKCYTISTSNTRVYSDTALTRGYGWIYPTDEVSVILVTGRYSKVSYPAGNRTKTGYISTSAILTATGGTTYRSSGRFTTYRRDNTANVYGYVDTNDNVKVLGTRGSLTQIKYNVAGGFKYAFASTSDVNRYVKKIGNSNNSNGNTAKVANGTYTLVSALNNDYVADISGGDTSSGANCQLYQSNGTDAQKFTFTYNSDGYYTITNINSGKVLDCATGGSENGLNIWQYDSNSTSAQRWKLTDVGGGYYTITCKCNGKCIDVSGGNVYNGNNIQIYESNGTASQKWKLVAVSSTGSSSNASVAQKIVDYELSQVGIGDYKGNNNVKYNTWYYGRTVSGSGHAWCMAFQAYCCNQITGSNNAIPKTASCTYAVNEFKNRGQFYYSKYYGGNYTPKAGDIVYYTNGSKYSSCHVGMIISEPVNGYLQTVEGNIQCSDGNWKVVKFTKNAKRTVSSSYVLGYAVPSY